MKNEVRILYVNGGLMDLGGISSYMVNYSRHLYQYGIIVDFVVHGFGVGLRDSELENTKSIIYHVPIKSKDYCGNKRGLQKIFKTNKYKIVHTHMDSGNMVVLREAKKCGIPIRISHSHNTEHLTNNLIKIIFNNYAKSRIANYATHLFSCSNNAGEWLYGKSKMDSGKVTVISNAIDLKKYEFNINKRIHFRKKLNLNNEFVIGHVGRFDFQKNHRFILKLFQNINSKVKNVKLLLIGDGLLKDEIEKLAIDKNLESNIIFLGSVNNVYDYYNVMDIFILPSLFEGLGISLIEAQANGLTCFASDTIPNEANPSNTVEFLNLEDDINIWTNSIIKSIQNSIRRNCNIKNMKFFNIETESEKLANIYIKMEENAS